jgi:hypothetical protein
MHDDLLPVEGGIEVRHDPDGPRVPIADPVGLGRRPVFASGAERALVELRRSRLLDQPPGRARTPPAIRSDGDEPPRERISAKIQRGRGTA